MAKKTAPKIQKKFKNTQTMPAMMVIVIVVLMLFAVVLTAAKVSSEKAITPNAPESEPAAAEKGRIGDPVRMKTCGTRTWYWYCKQTELCGKKKDSCLPAKVTPTPTSRIKPI